MKIVLAGAGFGIGKFQKYWRAGGFPLKLPLLHGKNSVRSAPELVYWLVLFFFGKTPGHRCGPCPARPSFFCNLAGARESAPEPAAAG